MPSIISHIIEGIYFVILNIMGNNINLFNPISQSFAHISSVQTE